MNLPRVIIPSVLLLLGGCGHVAELRPAAGHSLPVKPFMARTTPTPAELLTIPSYAKPTLIDELMKRSEPRPADPFDLPPATGGAAPSLPPGSQTLPVPTPSIQTPPGN